MGPKPIVLGDEAILDKRLGQPARHGAHKKPLGQHIAWLIASYLGEA